MSKRVFDNDRSMYNLGSLRLDVVEDEENSINNSIDIGTRRFKVIGSGSFGSIYKGTILKSRKLQFQADPEFRILGNYHGQLLAVNSSNKRPIPLQEEDFTLIIQVAVKQILKQLITEPEKHELIREASNLKVLWGRRNFVTIYGLTKSHDLGCLCLVMDFVSGCNLNEFLRSRGKKLDLDAEGARMCGVWESSEVLWWIQKLKLFREIVIALIVCHREKLYHGDLKGANVLLDKSLVPKLVDFGLSFRRADVSYLRSVGGSLFWCAPEVADPPSVGTIQESEVVADPYPSDVYSLGMVLVEILLDGNVPDDITDVEFFKADKWDGGCPISLGDVKISLGDVESRNSILTEKVLNELKELIDRCCEAERKDRISLHDCLSKVNHVFSDLCSCIEPLSESSDYTFTDTKAYAEMVLRFNERFPSVPDCMILNPSWNMVMDDEENLLVHYFCKLDYVEGVKYILEKRAFQPETDLPYLALLCVTEESLRTLKYLAASWPDGMKRQLLLLHKACFCNNPEVFRFLLLDVGIHFDTWERNTFRNEIGSPSPLKKPIHTLAAKGKTELVKLILDNCEVDADYVNTCIAFDTKTPLQAAIEGGDNPETITFLLGRGGRLLNETGDRVLNESETLGTLFELAIHEERVKVCIELLEQACNTTPEGFLFRADYPSCSVLELKSSAVDAQEHLTILKQHVQTTALFTPSINLLQAACLEGNEEALRSILWLMFIPHATNHSLAHKLLSYIVCSGSTTMVDLVSMFIFGTGQFQGHTTFRDQICAPDEDSDNPNQAKEISYASKVLSDFETGACEQVIGLHFDIEFPYALARQCCEKGYLGVLQFLEACGLDLSPLKKESKDPRCRWDFLLDVAAWFGHVDLAKFLLERGCSVNRFIENLDSLIDPLSPLQYACGSSVSMRKKEMVALLLDAGAKLSELDRFGYSAWGKPYEEDPRYFSDCVEKLGHYFVLNSAVEIVPAVSFFDRDGDAYRAAAETYATKVLSDFETGSCEQVISLHFNIEFPIVLAALCCEKGYLGILQFLEDCGLDLRLLIDKGDVNCFSLLHTAAEYGHVNVAKFLLSRGFPVDSSVNGSADSPLQRAVRSHSVKKKEMVAFLLDAGADPNYTNKMGYNAMDMVNGPPYKGVRDMVSLLVEAGFDIGGKDRWGDDYMDIVTRIGTTELTEP